MSGIRFDEFVARFWSDEKFRRAFAKNPREKLREFGFDPDIFDIPDQIDAAELEQSLERRRKTAAAPGGSRLSSTEAWSKFTLIQLKPEVDAFAHAQPIALVGTTTSLIYGTTAQTQVVVSVAGNDGAKRGRALERLQRLRTLRRQPDAALSISVELPDGRKVEGLTVDAARALLNRIR